MRKLFVLVLTFSSSIFFHRSLLAQDRDVASSNVSIGIPEIALLDVEPLGTNAVALRPKGPAEAGNFLDFSDAVDESLWINYSSVIGSTSEPSRKVTVSISSGYVPEGMELYVAASDAVSGKGTLGIPVGKVRLTESPIELITDIGSCYTEDGKNHGHQLSYSLELRDEDAYIAELDFDEQSSLVITYTLSDN